MEKTPNYAKGDWIVHAFYGIGRIKGLETKSISGEDARYYKIETADSTFWVPVDQIDSAILRPLSTPEDIEQALHILERPPKEMSSNYKIRRTRIKTVQLQNSPKAIARLVRDLRALQRKKGVLNQSEGSIFRRLKEQFVREWVIISGEPQENVAVKLDQILDLHR